MSDTWEAIASALAGVPRLDGARCVGMHEWFDPHDQSDPFREEDQADALRLCARCPALERCGEWLESLPRQKRPKGVVAGRVIA